MTKNVYPPEPIPLSSLLPLRSLAEVEREHILATLVQLGGNRSKAARVLGIDRRTLYRRLAEYARDISPERKP